MMNLGPQFLLPGETSPLFTLQSSRAKVPHNTLIQSCASQFFTIMSIQCITCHSINDISQSRTPGGGGEMSRGESVEVTGERA